MFLPNQLATNGMTSARATVAAAIKAPEAVDIMAATAAASTRPPMPIGSRLRGNLSVDNVLAEGLDVDVRQRDAGAMPIRAPAAP